MSGQGTFICYRREDSQGDAGRIDDRLRPRYGRERVFRDVHDSPPGVPFPDHLRGTIRHCRVVVVVIGKRWVELLHARRDRADDWVRIEVETALASPGVTVIPVLVQGATMPSTDDLPDGIRALAYVTAHELRDGRPWDNDMNRLIAVIDRMVPPLPGQPPPRGTDWGSVIGLVVVLAVVTGVILTIVGGIAAGVLVYYSLKPKPTSTPAATLAPAPTPAPSLVPTLPILPTFPTLPPTPGPDPTPLPDFVAQGGSPGVCSNGYCNVSFSFRNYGGYGNAIATIYLRPCYLGSDGVCMTTNNYLSRCTKTIPYTDYLGSASVMCSLPLKGYQGKFYTNVVVNNP